MGSPDRLQVRPLLCVLAAMRREVAPLLARLHQVHRVPCTATSVRKASLTVQGARMGWLTVPGQPADAVAELQAEGKSSLRVPVMVAWFGMGAQRARSAARWLASHRELFGPGDVALLVGIAGGLDPQLRVGEVVGVHRVFSGVEGAAEPPVSCADPAPELVQSGAAVTVPGLVCEVSAKSNLWQRLGAPPRAVVDMESYPFVATLGTLDRQTAVARVVSDGAQDPLPRALAKASGPDGIGLAALLTATLGQPPSWGQLIQLRRRTREAGEAIADLVQTVVQARSAGQGEIAR